MPVYENDGVRLAYEEYGSGPPVLLLAPGGMRSAGPLWERAPFDPRTALADEFRLISMDQRNAGDSSGPVSGDDGWHTYTRDQLALLDHLGIERCHVLGMCIGGPFCLGLMHADPGRIASGVLLQPIGFDNNQAEFYTMFDAWADELRPARPDVAPEALDALRSNLFDADFVFNLSREQVRAIEAPMLVLRGDDPYHPSAVSEELAELAPGAELIGEWKTGDALEAALVRVREFLRRHS